MVEAKPAPRPQNYFHWVKSLRHDQVFAIWDQILSIAFSDSTIWSRRLAGNAPRFRSMRAGCCGRNWAAGLGTQGRGTGKHGRAAAKPDLIGALGHYGDKVAVVAEAKARFENFYNKPRNIAGRPAAAGL